MNCEEAQELITARVDNELAEVERVAIETHLKSCRGCAQAFEQESLLKRRVQLLGRQVNAPAGLRRAVEGIKPVKNAPARKIEWRRYFAEAKFPVWRRAFVAIMIAVSAVSLYQLDWRGGKEESIGLAALEIHESIVSGKTALLRAVNLPAMRQELARAVGDRFKPVVLDLSLAKLSPVAGFVRNIGGRDLLVTVYQGDGPSITCFTFLGSEADAPSDGAHFLDAKTGIDYVTFTRGDISGVLHREGDVICLLVANMAPADLLAMLRGKSAHA